MLKYPLTIIFKRKGAESQSSFYCFASSRLCVLKKYKADRLHRKRLMQNS